jgi:acyl-CoA thioester hydrolase
MTGLADGERELPHLRADYRHYHRIATRWIDNDAYGHVNNVVYLSWFDTVVNEYLIRSHALDPQHGAVIGLVVETHCRYLAPLSFPQPIDAALRVARIGRSSVRYEIAIFAEADDSARAQGHFVHVYVDRTTRKPTLLPAALREALQRVTA